MWDSRAALDGELAAPGDLFASTDVGSYFTDGTNLYRLLGPISAQHEDLVGIENCRSLDVMLMPAAELRHHRLRLVAGASA